MAMANRVASRTWLIVVVAAHAGVAGADAPPKDAPAPCVNRGSGLVRPLHHLALSATSLQFCLGNDCWSLDRATTKFIATKSIAPIKPQASEDPPNTLTDGHGVTLATADAHHVEFCPKGRASCKSFTYELRTPAAGIDPSVNDARTLGAIVYRGAAEPDDPNHGPSYVLAFDLATGKQLGKLEGSTVTVLDHGFVVDSAKLFDAKLAPIGALAAHDEVWIKVGPTTDVIALRDHDNGDIVIQDTRTAKVRARIPIGIADKSEFFGLVASPDGAKIYAVGTVRDEGDTLIIDATAGKLVGRASPPVCVAGTMRRS
ncbi:MAG TPA: hypothetical protein VGO00_09345 [Kofleriaceae bacterium]|nr:hypothetical protein [Kofleriaceae bacterium]